MQRTVLHKLLLARRLYDLARENLSSANDLSLAIGVNLLQDAVEYFLLAVAEQVNAQIEAKTAFDQYFTRIDAKIAPKELPFRSRLVALNKLRVNSKHFGLAPAKSEVSALPLTVREFFEAVTTTVLGANFSTISLIDLLAEGEAKDLLKAAEAAYVAADYESCLFNARKALFVKVESHYDVRPYKDNPDPRNVVGFGIFISKAPYWARNKEYIDANVSDPTEYVVFDHSKVELDLMKDGMDTTSFWNVWRLTPSVYRASKETSWIEKRDLDRLDPDGIKERAEYVLDTTITLLLSAEQKVAAARWTRSATRHYVELREEEVPLYEKASTKSKVATKTPKGVKKLYVDFSIQGLDGSEIFWHVSHWDETLMLYGYLPESDTIH